ESDGAAHVQTHDDRNQVPANEKLPPQYERVFLSSRFIIENFSYLCEALERIPEGDGTVLDNCLVYATSELADGTRHTYTDMPVLLAGSAGGRVRSGVHFRAPSSRNTSDIPLTCMHALGVAADGFGSGPSRSTSPVSELLV
ncbi:MAG: hypothetical protein AAGF12_30455, partial [Myxococcota bacterium]